MGKVEAKRNENKTNLSNNRRRSGCGDSGKRVTAAQFVGTQNTTENLTQAVPPCAESTNVVPPYCINATTGEPYCINNDTGAGYCYNGNARGYRGSEGCCGYGIGTQAQNQNQNQHCWVMMG